MQKLSKSNISGIVGLNDTQMGMLFSHLNNPELQENIVQICIRIDGEFCIDTFRLAILKTQKQNEVLRSVFRWEKLSKPVQIILKECELDISCVDYLENTNINKREEIDKLMQIDRQGKLDLLTTPIKIKVVTFSNHSYSIIFKYHHILFDGWSLGVFLDEVFSSYKHILKGTLTSEVAKLSYQSYFKSTLKEEINLERLNYWEKHLENVEINLLQSIKTKKRLGQLAKKVVYVSKKEINDFATSNSLTISSIIYATHAILLSKLLNTSDIVFGATVSNRNAQIWGIESLMGNLINTIPVRIKNINDKTLGDVVKTCFQLFKNNSSFHNISLYEIKKMLNLKPFEELFDSSITIENYPLKTDTLTEELDISVTLDTTIENTGFPLMVSVFIDENLKIEFAYDQGLISENQIKLIAEKFKKILELICSDSSLLVKHATLLSERESNRILKSSALKGGNKHIKQSVIELFEQQASKTPNSVALSFNSEELTYRDLNEKANQLANVLNRKGIKRGDLIGIVTERSFDMIIGIFGILKAGAAYLPIDPFHPSKRINYILEDTGVEIVLASKGCVSRMQCKSELVVFEEIVYLDKDRGGGKYRLDGEDLFYVNYTSGSTGLPKGVMVKHSSVANLLYFLQAKFPVNSLSSYLLKTSYCFDVSLTELFGWILGGGKLIILPNGMEKEPEQILNTIHENSVTHINFVPSVFSSFSNMLSLDNRNKLKSLQYLMFAGEALRREHLEKIIELDLDIQIENLYGPTETTVYASHYSVDISDKDMEIYIGKPLPNYSLLILDNNLQIQPVGVAGELCIGGDGLAIGYAGNVELTQTRFVQHPYIDGEKLYRTGDKAELLSDGNIKFLGRLDDQIKINGFRIELGEIEHNLISHNSIENAVVLLQTYGLVNYLVGYYSGAEELDSIELKNYLEKRLPVYMVPSHYIYLKSIELTTSGKINRKALPDFNIVEEIEIVPPNTENEKLVVGILKEMFGIKNISINSDFISLGGDSIKSIQLSSKLLEKGYSISVNEILKSKFIKDIAFNLERKASSVNEQSNIKGISSPTPIQYQFLGSAVKHKNQYNQSVLLKFKDGISNQEVKLIAGKLCEHHDALRMVLKEENSKYLLVNEEYIDIESVVTIKNLTNNGSYENELYKLFNEQQSSIDLFNGPLINIGVYHTKSETQILVVMHHLITDGISWRIFLSDFNTLLTQSRSSKELSLPQKTFPYILWSEKVKEYSETEISENTLSYWNKLINTTSSLIPRDIDYQENIYQNVERLQFSLTSNDTKLLLANAHKTFNTNINDILLTSLIFAVNSTFGIESLILDMEGHGREEIDAQLNVSRTIGWYTVIYPVVLAVCGKDVVETLINVKERLREMPNNGFDFILLKKNKLDSKSYSGSNICFNYLGQFDQDIKSEYFDVSLDNKGNERALFDDREYDLEINGMVKNHELLITIDYGKKQFNTRTIEKLIDSFKVNLLKVIHVCCSYNKTLLTPSDITVKGISQNSLMNLQDSFDIADVYPLTPMQEGILFHGERDKDSNNYFEQLALGIEGAVEISSIQKAFDGIISRYEVLRASFMYEETDVPIMIISEQDKAKVNFKDLSHLDENQFCTHLEKLKKEDRQNSFNLKKGNLFRLLVIKKSDGQWILLFSYHHILIDGWSLGIVLKEFFATYKSINNSEPLLSENSSNYKGFIKWVEKMDDKRSKDYWANYLSGFDDFPGIPHTNTQQQKAEYCLASIEGQISKEVTNRLTTLTKENGITLSMIFQSAWSVFLSKYTNTQNITYGSVISGRSIPVNHIDSTVGLLINTIPVAAKVNHTHSFLDFIKLQQDEFIEGMSYHHTSLVEVLNLPKEINNVVIDHLFVFENFPVSDLVNSDVNKESQKDELRIVDCEVFEQTNYDLVTMIHPDEEITVKINFNENSYSRESIVRMINYFVKVIEQISENISVQILDIDILSYEEQSLVINEFNKTEYSFSDRTTIVDLFNSSARRYGDNIALICNNSTLTYRELDISSNQLSNLLIKVNSTEGLNVGVVQYRSINLITSLIGILKSGNAYVPIEPSLPLNRQIEIINAIKCETIIINKDLLEKVTENIENYFYVKNIIVIDELEDKESINNLRVYTQANIRRESNQLPQQKIDSEDNAYIIFTSGTSGTPKGVVVQHRPVVNLIEWAKRKFTFDSSDRVLFTSSVSFDLSVFDIFGFLAYGGSIHIVNSEDVKDPSEIATLLVNKGITFWDSAPQLLQHVLQFMLENKVEGNYEDLRLSFLSGDWIPLSQPDSIHSLFKNCKFIALGGATEATVWSNYYEVSSIKPEWKSIPYGKPIQNAKYFILDNQLKACPIGTPGDLYIGGDCLAKEYFGDVDLTNRKFIENPFTTGEKIYNTGDRARWYPDGNIEFLGRLDNQVKIRGYRIELGDIEFHFNRLEKIDNAIVRVKEVNGEKSLVGYYISKKEVPSEEITSSLSSNLPDYMIPLYYIKLDRYPSTSNGKIDVKALPIPDFEAQDEIIKATNGTEEQLVEMWSEILDLTVEQISIEVNFSDLGGHSLKLMKLKNLIYKTFGLSISVKDLSSLATINSIAKHILNQQWIKNKNTSNIEFEEFVID